jgi:hypothetical protein
MRVPEITPARRACEAGNLRPALDLIERSRHFIGESAMAQSARNELLEFLDRRAFEPVLRARPEHYPEPQRSKLEDVQRRTRTEIERFHRYGSARDIVANVKRDLDSEPARKVHAELKELGLPTLDDIKDEFLKLAGDLRVGA